jgi:hypothetical protein
VFDDAFIDHLHLRGFVAKNVPGGNIMAPKRSIWKEEQPMKSGFSEAFLCSPNEDFGRSYKR